MYRKVGKAAVCNMETANKSSFAVASLTITPSYLNLGANVPPNLPILRKHAEQSQIPVDARYKMIMQGRGDSNSKAHRRVSRIEMFDSTGLESGRGEWNDLSNQALAGNLKKGGRLLPMCNEHLGH